MELLNRMVHDGVIAWAVGAGGVAVTSYFLWIRPWHLRWGATDEEVARAMPGDEVVKQPAFNATRAITIGAEPDEIWPWLVQVGCKRAGWYSYDWIDNLGIPSAERILPALQGLRVGDIVPMSPDGKQGMTVEVMDQNRFMLWASKDHRATWGWELDTLGPNQTRLLTRVRMRYQWTWLWPVFNLLFDPGDFVMMSRMLLGLKRRAERLAKRRTMAW